jgi:hypothetical protein
MPKQKSFRYINVFQRKSKILNKLILISIICLLDASAFEERYRSTIGITCHNDHQCHYFQDGWETC